MDDAPVMPSVDRLTAFGAALKARRDELGLTQGEVAEAAQIESTSVSRYERGKGGEPTARKLRALDTALRWPPGTTARLLRGEPPIETEPGSDPGEDQAVMIAAQFRAIQNHLTPMPGDDERTIAVPAALIRRLLREFTRLLDEKE